VSGDDNPPAPAVRIAAGRAARPTPRRWWPDAIVLAVGAAILRIPALLAPTNLGYDDGGYGLAAVAMRQGAAPFRDIFSPQGPLFLPLLHVADLVGLQTRDAPRLLAVAAGMVTTVAVYAAACEITDRGRALLAGALTATSGVLLWTTGPITGDGPGAAFATAAVAVALTYRRAPSRPKAVAVALLLGGALAIKSLLVGPALLIAWLLVLSRRRVLDAVLVPIGALALVLVAALPWGLTPVVDDYVRYHLGKTGNRTPGANLDKIVTTFARRDLPMVVIGALGLVAALGRRFGRRAGSAAGASPDLGAAPAQDAAPVPDAAPDPSAARDPSAVPDLGAVPDLRAAPAQDAAPDPRVAPAGPGATGWARAFAGDRFLWWWAGLVLVVLVAQAPMFRNHLAALVPPLALLVATWRPSWRSVAVAAVLTVPFQVVQLRPLYLPRDYTGTDAVIVDRLRALPDHAWAMSDEPGLVWRAGLGTDPYFVDPSVLRVGIDVPAIAITEDKIVAAARAPRMCAVAITSPARFGSFPGLPGRLEALGYQQERDFGGGRGLWIRNTTSCR
jgi:hypothetical protein